MLIHGQVGQPGGQSVQPGKTPAIRAGQLGELITSPLHGQHYEQAYRRNMYAAGSNTVTTSIGTSTTFSGLLVYNPPNSQVNLTINKVGVTFSSAFAANTAIGVQLGSSANTIAGFSNANTSIVNTNTSVPYSGFAQAYSSANVTGSLTPTHYFGAVLGSSSTASPLLPTYLVNFEGSIVVAPGGYIATYTSTASAANSLYATVEYEEVPI